MAIEAMQDKISYQQVVGKEQTQALIEGTISIPDDYQEIGELLDVTGAIILNSKEIIKDKIMLEGIVKCNVIYTASDEDSSIVSVEGEVPVTHYIDMSGVEADMSLGLSSVLEHLEYNQEGSRKIGIHSVLGFNCQVTKSVDMNVVSNFGNDTSIQVLKKSIRLTSISGNGLSKTIVRDNIEIYEDMPSIKEIIRKDASLRVNEKKVADNKVIVHGDIMVGYMYLCDEEEDKIQYISSKIPFSHFVEIEGAYQGMDCSVDTSVEEVYAVAKPDINEDYRVIETEVMINLAADVYTTFDKQVVVDSYSPDVVLDVAKKNVDMIRLVGENQDHTSIKGVIESEGLNIKRIIHADCSSVISDYNVKENFVEIEGTISAKILYQTLDNSISQYSSDLPFKQEVAVDGIEGDMDCEFDSSIENVNCTVTNDGNVDIRATVVTKVSGYDTCSTEVVLGVEEVMPIENKNTGIFVYFVRPGDTLWSVAKRYNTTIENITAYNDFEENYVPQNGQKILIYNKIDTSIA